MHRLRLVFVTLVMLVALAFVPGAKVAAQGYRMGLSSALPGPVSSLELSRLGSMMLLTAEQMRAWSGMHERYKNDFKALGASGGTVAAFIEARKAAEGIPFRAQPPRSVTEKWMNAHQSANNAIAALDARLLDELLPLLAEEQQPLLQRARLSCDRTRLAGDEIVFEWLDPNTKTDLCALFASFEKGHGAAMTAEQKALVWSALDAYQTQYVSKLRGVRDAAQDMYREWAKLLEERGVPVNAVDLAKRDTMDREMFMQVSRAWSEVTQKVKPRLTEMSKFNRGKANSIAALMSSESADLFTREFLETAYPGVSLVQFESLAKTLRRALEFKDLSDAERTALQALLDDCLRTTLALSEEEADAQDMIAEGQIPNASRQSPEARKRMEDARAASNEADERLYKSLSGVISPDRLKPALGAGGDAGVRKMLAASGVTDPEETEELLAEYKRTGKIIIGKRSTPDSAIPDAISKSDLAFVLASLQPNEELATIARQLHGDYTQQYRQTLDDANKALTGMALAGLTLRDDGKGGKVMGFASPGEIEKGRAIESQAISVLRQLDRAFFDDLQAALGLDADSLWRARLARDWATLARGERMGLSDLRTYEAYVQLVAIVDGLKLAAEESTSADAVFHQRAEELRAATSAHFQANRAAWYGRCLANASSMGMVRASQEEIDKAEHDAAALDVAAAERRAALAVLVRAMLEELITALPSRSDALLDGYERAAYPRVFDDPKGRRDALARALALSDLTDPQRAQLQAAAEKYRPAWRDVCTRLIEADREWDKPRPYSRFQNPEREEAKLKWDQLVFERDELDTGVVLTLQRVLTPEQRAAIGLGDPK